MLPGNHLESQVASYKFPICIDEGYRGTNEGMTVSLCSPHIVLKTEFVLHTLFNKHYGKRVFQEIKG
jgi:hypothetical protein